VKSLSVLSTLALLFGAAPSASALDIYSNGEHTRIDCRTVYGCFITHGPRADNSARIIHVPDYTPPNINDNWGGGCRSCVDLAKPPAASFEASQ
jgi:hypothetical protein